jgi:hypothetical protein
MVLISAWVVWYCTNTTTAAIRYGIDQHNRCHEHTEDLIQKVTSQVGPLVLRAAAEKFDAIEEQHKLKQMAAQEWKPDGPSVPAIWMLEQAEILEHGLKVVLEKDAQA